MVYLMIALNYTLLCPTFSRCLCHFISGLSLVLMPFSSFVNTKFTSPGASRTEFLKTRKPYHSPLPLKTHIKVPQPSEQRTISFRGFLRTPSYFSPLFPISTTPFNLPVLKHSTPPMPFHKLLSLPGIPPDPYG